MKTPSLYGAYNARWLTPREVADTFVPIPQYQQLVQTHSSVLMGPRGCGKTTLLKMLTPEAQDRWHLRISEDADLAKRIETPAFLAIYVPSDLRWTYELSSTGRVLSAPVVLLERIQRYMITLTALVEALTTFESLVAGDLTVEKRIVLTFLDMWKQRRLVPSFGHLRVRLLELAATVRGAINERDPGAVEQVLKSLPPVFGAHAVDALTLACSTFEAEGRSTLKYPRWALCFDELEIAPEWLQQELLRSLRSISQRFLLKLTWTPVLPELLLRRQAARPEHKQDFEPIRLWQSHLGDANDFSKELTTNILRSRSETDDATPRRVFGRSPFAATEEHTPREYARDSPLWSAMIDLAKMDDSFDRFLRRKSIDPHNPTTRNRRKRDQVLRKVKPIVLLRREFLKQGQRRSRKRSLLYSGEETIYAMSDGNPRWLVGVVNELIDAAAQKKRGSMKTVPKAVQSEVLMAASHRMKLHVKYLPAGHLPGVREEPSLYELVERLGEICREQVLGSRFTDDPVGSFIVDAKAGRALVSTINRGLTLGALIAITDGVRDVPEAITHTRFRLSFMLSPSYHLLFRNYRWVSLSTALADAPGQLNLHLLFP
jgi:hypothetical protein